MTKLEQDLEFAYALIEDREKINDYNWLFYRMWPFATVNMREYLDPLDLEGKICATLQGSSDHVFELFLKKPQKIIGFDTNPLTEHYCYLKTAAFGALATPEDFLKFFRWMDYPKFCYTNHDAFDRDVFQEISKYLVGESKLFWEDLFQKYEPKQIRSKLFTTDEENNRGLAGALTYLTPENYEYIRNNIGSLNYSFMGEDVRTLVDKLPEKIDFITLSNLIIYSHYMFPENPALGFKCLTESLSHKLNDKGQIVVGYLYDIEHELNWGGIYKASERDAIFTAPDFSYHYFSRMHDLHCGRESDNHDACIVYTKAR